MTQTETPNINMGRFAGQGGFLNYGNCTAASPFLAQLHRTTIAPGGGGELLMHVRQIGDEFLAHFIYGAYT